MEMKLKINEFLTIGENGYSWCMGILWTCGPAVGILRTDVRSYVRKIPIGWSAGPQVRKSAKYPRPHYSVRCGHRGLRPMSIVALLCYVMFITMPLALTPLGIPKLDYGRIFKLKGW